MSKSEKEKDTQNDSGDFEQFVKNIFAVPPEELEEEIQKDRQAGLPVPEPDPKDTKPESESNS